MAPDLLQDSQFDPPAGAVGPELLEGRLEALNVPDSFLLAFMDPSLDFVGCVDFQARPESGRERRNIAVAGGRGQPPDAPPLNGLRLFKATDIDRWVR